VNTILPYRFVDRIAELPVVDAIYLFGSRARGDNDRSSDIDLAVSCPGASGDEWDQVLDIVEDADTLLMIDCVRLDEAPAHWRERILAEGKLLHERRPAPVQAR
jgi:predicted nucleotidyltransferase